MKAGAWQRGKWVPVHQLNERVNERIRDVFENEPTIAIAHPEVAITTHEYEKLAMSNQRLYQLAQDQEQSIKQLRQAVVKLKRLLAESEQRRAQAHHAGVVQALERASDEVMGEFGVRSLNIVNLLEDVRR